MSLNKALELSKQDNLRLHRKTGTYALILRSLLQKNIAIGKLGKMKLRKGYYIYIGSAFGPGGILARIKHHCRIAKSPHWHIDYLIPAVEIAEVWYSTDQESREHQWANIVSKVREVELPLKGFGSSDCTCDSHLFFSTLPISIRIFNSWLGGGRTARTI